MNLLPCGIGQTLRIEDGTQLVFRQQLNTKNYNRCKKGQSRRTPKLFGSFTIGNDI